MLLENLAIGRSVEIYDDRDGYCFHLTSKIEETSAKRVYISLIATNTRVFEFKPGDKIRIVYRDESQIWEWDNVKAGITKKYGTKMHYLDISDGGRSFNRRNAYRVNINEEVMIGYYNQQGTEAKSADMPVQPDGQDSASGTTEPDFADGIVRDISETGVGICSNYRFNIDDGIFFNISSYYGSLAIKAKVVRKIELNPSRNKYSNYYGCLLLQTDNRLSRHIIDIQRDEIRAQKQKQAEEELDKAFARLENGIASNKKNTASKIDGIRTVAGEEKTVKNKPRPKIEGIRTADDEPEVKEIKRKPRPKIEGIRTADDEPEVKEIKRKPRPKIEGIRTADDEPEVKEIKRKPRPKIEGIRTADDEPEAKEIKRKPRPKIEGIITMDDLRDEPVKKKSNNTKQPEIEGIKTAGLK